MHGDRQIVSTRYHGAVRDLREFPTWLNQWAQQCGAFHAAVAPASAPAGSERLRQWLELGAHGGMDWWARTVDQRADVRERWPTAQSVLVFAWPYDHAPQRPAQGVLPRISRYARGRDYHTVLSRYMRKLRTLLIAQWGATVADYSVDAGAVHEKLYAQAAGLGWIGRHSNLIHREYGSYFFLSALVTDLRWDAMGLEPVEPEFLCGSCSACVDVCPTQAIAPGGWVDAARCVSYQTIEWPRAASTDALDDAPAVGHGWLHGCDDCQEVCPWVRRARRVHGSQGMDAFAPHARWAKLELSDLAQATDAQLAQWQQASPLARERASGLRSNARRLLAGSGAMPRTDIGKEES